MKNFFIFSKWDAVNTYKKQFKDGSDCRNWIINHLDLSKEWEYTEMI